MPALNENFRSRCGSAGASLMLPGMPSASAAPDARTDAINPAQASREILLFTTAHPHQISKSRPIAKFAAPTIGARTVPGKVVY